MILHKVRLHNFGIYDDARFVLTPSPSGNFDRPITLLRGKNGVGKTTLVEAIRLCLHGPLALGSRVGQQEYEDHLQRRIHRDTPTGPDTFDASIEVHFDFVGTGRMKRYIVTRSWARQGNSIDHSVNISEDGIPLSDSAESKEFFLRELVPPGIIDVFFFDGEKIATLAEANEASDLLLADTMKTLLGLHLVEQLDRDLNIFITRQEGVHELHYLQTELEALNEQDEALRLDLRSVRRDLAAKRKDIAALQQQITALEQRIASEGGQYAATQTARSQEIDSLMVQIDAQEHQVHELCRELAPFASAPRLLNALSDRLEQEAAYQRWLAAQDVLDTFQDDLVQGAASESFWEGIVSEPPTDQGRKTFGGRLAETANPYRTPPMAESEVIHRLSPAMHRRLVGWITDALGEAPRQLANALHISESIKTMLAEKKAEFGRVPVEAVLAPLRRDLAALHRQHGREEHGLEQLEAREQRLIEQQSVHRRKSDEISQQIARHDTSEDRVKLAARTKLLLTAYQEQLTKRKLAQLEKQLEKRFNQLIRKRNFVERVSIKPETFSTTLYRGDTSFRPQELSAGEQQVFAIATLWALREVSNRPMPVIIDTPLSRLDSDHRQSMIDDIFPHVAHQVIILATETEIDDRMINYLRPAISNMYLLNVDEASGTTQVIDESPNAVSRIALKEISIHAGR